MKVRIINRSEWHNGFADFVRHGKKERVILEPKQRLVGADVDSVDRTSPYVEYEIVGDISSHAAS